MSVLELAAWGEPDLWPCPEAVAAHLEAMEAARDARRRQLAGMGWRELLDLCVARRIATWTTKQMRRDVMDWEGLLD